MAVKHLTTKDIAERLGLSQGSVYQMNSRATGPPYLKIGRHVRYRLADVEAWETTREATGGHLYRLADVEKWEQTREATGGTSRD